MSNRLSSESSPYLLQHAQNPVDWYPWGSEATKLAIDKDLPILLSVGYSACHWCHVMAHESFEDPDIAAKMNASFVNVKVDREERPDIDALYMEAVTAMTGQGGWPMTVIMTPDGEPFFAGTYFPPTPRHGMPGFGELLDAIADAWSSKRAAVHDQAALVTDALQAKAGSLRPATDLANREVVARASADMVAVHDPANGGFGDAPKFPAPMSLDVLFRHYVAAEDTEALDVAELTLDHMAAGGIYDHLGFGFARYSVDATWSVPHFEKMLSDNALLGVAYLHGWQLTGNDRHLQVVRETIDYLMRDLRLSGGAFATAEDADSEGVEGLFYAWTHYQLEQILDDDEMTLVRDWYGVTEAGNFEGTTVLYRPTVAALDRPVAVEALREKLFQARLSRVRPGLDDKVLTEWNALTVSLLAEAGAATGEQAWVDAATSAMDFLEGHLLKGGRWYRSWHEISGHQHLAYAADYAALVDAYTRLGEATGQARWHRSALDTAEAMIELFWDDQHGGVFTTGNDAEQLIVKRKEFFDSPVPSANANAAFALARVGAIHGRDDLTDRGRQIIRLLGDEIGPQAMGHSRMVSALDLIAGGTSEIVISGDRPDLLQAVHTRYLPNAVVVHGEPFESPLWEGRNGSQAFVCKNYTCALPATNADTLIEQLTALAR